MREEEADRQREMTCAAMSARREEPGFQAEGEKDQVMRGILADKGRPTWKKGLGMGEGGKKGLMGKRRYTFDKET